MSLRVGRPEYGGTFAADGGGVRFVLPGELISLTDGLKVLEASPERVGPGCRHFGVCGGCDYQHAGYGAQLELKREILGDLLGVGEIRVHGSEPAWGYRSRVRMRVEMVNGVARVGYNRRGGREFLAVAECPIAAPLLWRAAEALLASGGEWLGSVAEVEFATNGVAVQMSVFTRDGRTAGFVEFCEGAKVGLPELVGAGVMAASAGYGAKERGVWGTLGMTQEVLGRRYWVTRGGFFQVNRFLVAEMVELVTGGRAGRLAWDLYAGVGLFSRVLAEGFEEVVGVEAGPAAEDLAKTGKNVRAVRAEVVEFLRAAVLQRERPEVIVMDPPRAGVGTEVCGLLARVAARELVYVSCDPVTLARDLKMLVDSGYRAQEVRLLDMFPQTFHIEAVVVLRR